VRRHLTSIGLLTVLVAVGTGGGCAGVSPPIRLQGRPADVQALAGEWAGEYQAPGLGGRSGSIIFTLAAGEDHAHGDVLMTPAGSAHGYSRYPGRGPFGPWEDFRAPMEALTIHFVGLDRRLVSGALDPYWDPDRECWATTTFVGELVEHTIAGTFLTRFSSTSRDMEGKWRVTRRPAKPIQVRTPQIAGIANAAEIESIVMIAGTIDPAQAVPAIKKRGYASIVNLRDASEPGANVEAERDAAAAAGLRFIHVPVNAAAPDATAADRFLEAMSSPGAQPAFIHCASGNRAAAMWLIKRMVLDHWDVDRASAAATRLGLTSPKLREFAVDYAERRLKGGWLENGWQ
jgi:uncharacterized protein (TIGR01244 family)